MKNWLRTAALLIVGSSAVLAQTSSSLAFYKNYFLKGDYFVVGAGTRGQGNSGVATVNLTLPTLPADADAVAAYLYWVSLEDAANPGTGKTITFRNYSITGKEIARPANPLSPLNRCVVYRAQIFNYLPHDPTTYRALLSGQTYQVGVPDSGILGTAPISEGISLVVVYRSSTLPFKSVVLYDGGVTVSSRPYSLNVQGFYQTSLSSPSAKFTPIVGDGQPAANGLPQNDQITFNGTGLGTPDGSGNVNVFTGSASGTPGGYWDNPTFNVSSLTPTNASSIPVTLPVTTGQDAIVLASLVFSTTVQDRDGDGLLDSWEQSGYLDMNGTSFINLPAMGANPNVRDMFVELDWMEGSGHTHKPLASAMKTVTDAFAKQGIVVHWDYGQDSNYNGGNSVGDETVVSPTGTAWKLTVKSPRSMGFAEIKYRNFKRSRRHIFRYQLWAHQRPDFPANYIPAELAGKPNTASGIADLPGSSSMITLGGWRHAGTVYDQVGTPEEQAGTMMHELGHTLGLHHGGNENTNCKPNYQSIMNYLHQTHGLQAANGGITFDYSTELLSALNENSLSELAGMPAKYRARFYVPMASASGGSNRRCNATFADASVLMGRTDASSNTGAVDWNGNLLTDASAVAADVNFDGSLTTLNGFLDWPALDLQQVSPGFAYTEGQVDNVEGDILNGALYSADGDILNADGDILNAEGDILNAEGDILNANGDILNAEGEILNSEIAGAGEYDYPLSTSVPPPPPTSLVSRVGTGFIRLSWNAVQLAIVTRYQVTRSVANDPSTTVTFLTTPTRTATTPAAALYNDTAVVRGVTYKYLVRTVDENGHISNQSSNTITVTAQ